MNIKFINMKNTELSQAISQAMFGWRWVSFQGIPTIDTDGYPNETRVRQFFSPEQLAHQQWIDYFAKHGGADATGDEPLSYRYCSSYGPACYPDFAADENEFRKVASKLVEANLWDKYVAELKRRSKKPSPEYWASLALRCRVALELWTTTPQPQVPSEE